MCFVRVNGRQLKMYVKINKWAGNAGLDAVNTLERCALFVLSINIYILSCYYISIDAINQRQFKFIAYIYIYILHISVV